jgi:hypothetical protein
MLIDLSFISLPEPMTAKIATTRNLRWCSTTEAMEGPQLGLDSISRSPIKGAHHGITVQLLKLERGVHKLMPVKAIKSMECLSDGYIRQGPLELVGVIFAVMLMFDYDRDSSILKPSLMSETAAKCSVFAVREAIFGLSFV